MRSSAVSVMHVAWAPFFSGAERAFLLLLKGLDPARYRPFVVSGTRGEFTHCLDEAGISNAVLPLVHSDWRHCVQWARSVGTLTRLALRERVSLVHSNELPSFQPAAYAARLARLPAICHVRFPFGGPAARWLLKPGFARAVFVSDALRREVVEGEEKFFGAKTDVVHDGVALPELPSLGDLASRRAALELPADVPLVLIAGQVSEVKGIWEFIEAARFLVSRGSHAHFVVLGDDLKGRGQLRREAEERVRALGIAHQFTFLGFRADAPGLIPLFDVVAVPSHVEPLGNATLEAMAAARPVVGANVGGIPEMVQDGVTGVLIPPRDAVALAEAIGGLLADRPRSESMGRAGRLRAASSFSVEAHAARVQAIYDEVLQSSRQVSRSTA